MSPLQNTDLAEITFDLYRYQLLPIDKSIQLSLNNDVLSFEDLIEKKNDLLASILKNENIFLNHQQSKMLFRLEAIENNVFVFRLGIKRNLKRNTKEFKVEEVENYPNILMIINNDKTSQKIAIQSNYKAFNNTSIPSHILQRSLTNFLKAMNLSIYVEPIYKTSDFWQIVENYPNKIKVITFDLIRPNLSNISGNIDKKLKELQTNIDAHKSKLEFESNKDSNLKIERDDTQINGLVDYSSQGGGQISVKVQGIKKKIKTNKSTEEITISEAEVTGTAESVAKFFKNLLK